MKVIISGGGTGGHIYPAIAIANALQQRNANASILFVGARGRMEMQKVPEAGYPIVGLNVAGFQRKQLWRNLSLPFKLFSSLWEARKLLRSFRPDVVVGTGGYASAPILYMAAQHQVATLIQEQNAEPGLTNHFLGRYVDKVCVAYEGMERFFAADKLIVAGNPVREVFLDIAAQRAAAYTHFELPPHKPCLLVLGGSLGASTINEGIFQALNGLLEAGLQLIWITGEAHFKGLQGRLTPQQRKAIRLYPFLTNMHFAYAAADMVVARAGAGTIAELCLAQKPTILIPSPNVTNDHQTKNALALVAQDAAWLLKDSEASNKMETAVLQLWKDADQRAVLSRNMQALARPQAATTIVQTMEDLINFKR